jgi:hypothetical protein
MTDETKLEAMAQRLGAPAAERLNVERTAAAVLARLRAEPPSASRWSWIQPLWLRIAATLVVLVGGGLIGRLLLVQPGTGVRGHEIAHFVRDDLTDLSTDQLREVLSTLDETLDLGRANQPETDLENLDAQQLRAVLRALEG